MPALHRLADATDPRRKWLHAQTKALRSTHAVERCTRKALFKGKKAEPHQNKVLCLSEQTAGVLVAVTHRCQQNHKHICQLRADAGALALYFICVLQNTKRTIQCALQVTTSTGAPVQWCPHANPQQAHIWHTQPL